MKFGWWPDVSQLSPFLFLFPSLYRSDGEKILPDLESCYVYVCLVVCVFTVTAEQLWKGVLAESGAGARKGRGKRTKRKLRRDLNRGQNIGEGETSSVCLTLF